MKVVYFNIFRNFRRKSFYFLFFLIFKITALDASDLSGWTLFEANAGSLERIKLFKGTLARDESENIKSDNPKMKVFLESCNQVLKKRGVPFFVKSFTYLSSKTPVPPVGTKDMVSLDFEFINNVDKSGHKTTRLFAIKSLQLLINQDLYIYDFNKDPPSKAFIATLRALCTGESLKLVFGGNNDVLILSSLTDIVPEKLINILDLQKLFLVLTGSPQLMNLQKVVKKSLSIQFEDIEAYKKLEFYEWWNDFEVLSLEQMTHGVVDVVFLPVLLGALDYESNPHLWTSYNFEMQRYYRKTLAQEVAIMNLSAEAENEY